MPKAASSRRQPVGMIPLNVGCSRESGALRALSGMLIHQKIKKLRLLKTVQIIPFFCLKVLHFKRYWYIRV
jgi:hypothetical protein